MFFDSMKNRNKETKNLGNQERKVEKGGKGAWQNREIGSKSEIGVVLNYTHLHVFTAFYTMFPAVNVTGGDEAGITTELPRHRGRTGCGRRRVETGRKGGGYPAGSSA